MQEMGHDYYKLHRRYDQDSEEEDPFEAERRIEWEEEEEKAKVEYFKMIAEEEERAYYRQTMAELIDETSLAKREKKEMEKDKENDEEADKSMKGSSLENDGSEELEEKGEKALDPADSYNPQEYDMTGVQEDSCQSQTTKELDKLREVETVRKSRSTKEVDELAEGDDIEQVIEDHFEEKKDEEDDKEEGSGKKPAPKVNKWLSWWKKRLTVAGDLHSNYIKKKNRTPEQSQKRIQISGQKTRQYTC